MIVLFVTHPHKPTELESIADVDLRVHSYNRALRSPYLRRATYVFGDLDRLDFWELEVAAHLYRHLRSAGATVLNDPARVRQRYSLLRTLKDEGINSFDAWRVEGVRRPERFPVFLRTESAHRGPLSDLLHDEAEVEKAVESALERGVPRRELLLVEYRGEPVRDGLFRKLGAMRVGDRIVPCLNAHDPNWTAKVGVKGIADQELYEEELEIIRTNRYADDLWPAFRAAEIEYGRADFGLVDGRVEVYEINTNPSIGRMDSHPFDVRMKSDELVFEKLARALTAADTAKGPWIPVDDEVLDVQRYHDRWMTWPRWTP